MTTLVLVFKKIEDKDKTEYDNIYSSSKAEIIINESDTDDPFQPVYTTIITKIQNLQEKVHAGLLIQSLIIILVFQSIMV